MSPPSESTPDDRPEISVIAPAYRCASCLPELYRRLVASLEPLVPSFEIILVNDASPQDDWAVIESIASRDLRVKGIDLSRNFGQHHALTAGVDHARGRWVVVMDADLQDPPEEIARLYARAKQGWDVVFSRRPVREHGAFKRLTSRLFSRVLGYLTDAPRDNGITHFSIASAEVARNFRMLREHDRSYEPLVRWLGFRTTFEDIEHHARHSGSSSYTLARMFRLALEMVVSQSEKPLRLSIGFGFAVASLALVFGAYQILRRLFWAHPIDGWTSVIVSIYLIGGLLFVNLGVVGLYVGRIFQETKGRPLYVVRARVNVAPPTAPPGSP